MDWSWWVLIGTLIIVVVFFSAAVIWKLSRRSGLDPVRTDRKLISASGRLMEACQEKQQIDLAQHGARAFAEAVFPKNP